MTTVKTRMFLVGMFLVWGTPAGRVESPRRIEIIAKRFTYDPDVISLKKSQPVVLVLGSKVVRHGLKIAEMNVLSENIRKGKETEIQFTPEETGHYVGRYAHFCGKGHGSMTLQIDVVP